MYKGPEVGADGIFNCEEASVAGVQFRLNTSSHDYVVMGVRVVMGVGALVFNFNETRRHRRV